MADWFEDVLAFHRKFGCRITGRPGIPPGETVALRAELVREEVEELEDAIARGDLAGIADACADSIYVLIGLAISYGIDLRPIWDEVQRSNMAKEGGGERFDGKVLKPDGWRGPDIDGCLDRQEPLR